jgi:3-hydroxyisobutyrate dehydrogenase
VQQVGFVGLGAMGSVMAPLLAHAGFSVLGFDPATQHQELPGVAAVTSLADMAVCDAIITMLPDGAVVTAVASELAQKRFRGLLIDMSSSHPQGTIKLGEKLAAQGIGLIDAPVSGGVKKAAVGTLMIMAGGDSDNIAAAHALIDCFGTMQHVGPLGAGHAIKALNNYVSAAGLLASMQALATAESFGITVEKFTSVINGSTGRNNTTEVKIMPFIASRRYDSGFFLRLMAKDVSIASELMTNAGFNAPITAALNSYLAEALDRIGYDADHTELYEMLNPAPKVNK